MASHYERYMLPVEPADLDAEYMTVQETAWVFKCHVATIRKRVKDLQLGGRVGRRIMLDKAERAQIFEASRPQSAARIPAQRRRKPPVKRAATKASAARAAA